jgi:hypothetical protein
VRNPSRYAHTYFVLAAVALVGCHTQAPTAKPPVAAMGSVQADAPNSSPVAGDQSKPKSQPPLIPKGPLGDVDKSFLDAYEARRTSVLANQHPYVVVSGSRLILHVPAKEIPPVTVIPDSYHALKDIAHTPFAAYLLLSPVERGIVDLKSQTDALNALQNRIEKAKTEVTDKWFTPEEIGRANQILDTTAGLIRESMQAQSVSKQSLDAFAKKLGPLMLANAWDAGCAQINATHAQMMTWKDSLSPEDWRELIAVNRARHQARYRNAATQYFSWLFDVKGTSWSYPGESMRVIYVESLGPGEDASDELATVLIDANASQAFFGDPWRLSEDILSDGAAACIQKLQPSSRYKN